jgi:hypothetical protein
MNRRDFFVMAGVTLASALVSGCSLDSADKDNEGRRRGRRRLEPDNRDTVGRGRGMDGIPRDAKEIDRLRYEAGNDGRIFLYDVDEEEVVYSGQLRKGEKFVADPESDKLTIDGKRVGTTNLRAKRRYRLYFDRGATKNERA